MVDLRSKALLPGSVLAVDSQSLLTEFGEVDQSTEDPHCLLVLRVHELRNQMRLCKTTILCETYVRFVPVNLLHGAVVKPGSTHQSEHGFDVGDLSISHTSNVSADVYHSVLQSSLT